MINSFSLSLLMRHCLDYNRKQIWIWLFLLPLLVFTREAFCSDNTDSKLWIEEEISYDMSDRLSFKLGFNERFDDDISRWEEIYIDTGIDYKLTDWLVLGPRYRYIEARFNSSDELIEKRFHMNIELKMKLKMLSVESRSRYEYRIFENDIIKHRFTERIKISMPLGWKIKDRSLEIYFSDELYYDIDNHEANNNENHLGVKLPLSKSLSLKLYYGHETKRRNKKWNFHTNIIGITAGYNF